MPYVVHLGSLSADLERRVVEGPDHASRLTANEAGLLAYLAARPGQAVSREELLQEVWGYSPDAVSRAVDFTVHRLRTKIEPEPSAPTLLLSEHGVGYKLAMQEAVPAPPVRHLPAEIEPILGRADDFAAVEHAMQQGRVASIVGPSGVGKSRLALAAAHRSASARLVPLAQPVGGDDALGRVARALDVPLADLADASLVEGRIGEALAASGPIVLVLDDADFHLETLRSSVLAWTAAAPQLRVLLTARAPLHVRGERVVRLGPLAPSAAESLFIERARAAGCPAAPEEAGLAAAAQIVRRLDCLPLSLELAASRCSASKACGIGSTRWPTCSGRARWIARPTTGASTGPSPGPGRR
ncbi:MAG: AAA family ATPase [Proteobacteria bacterium]|nr:AAA family ATPase [Pseudomonadota bacterium]